MIRAGFTLRRKLETRPATHRGPPYHWRHRRHVSTEDLRTGDVVDYFGQIYWVQVAHVADGSMIMLMHSYYPETLGNQRVTLHEPSTISQLELCGATDKVVAQTRTLLPESARHLQPISK